MTHMIHDVQAPGFPGSCVPAVCSRPIFARQKHNIFQQIIDYILPAMSQVAYTQLWARFDSTWTCKPLKIDIYIDTYKNIYRATQYIYIYIYEYI